MFHAKMGMIKDRKGKDLTESEEIKKKWQENAKNYTENILITDITMMLWSVT